MFCWLDVQSAKQEGLMLRVDESDATLLNGRSIYLDGKGYPSFWLDGRNVRVHRYLMGDPPGVLVDHKDRDVFNATRDNLRVCSKSQNGFNSGPRKNNTSGFKGVCATKEGHWRAVISVNRKQVTEYGFRTPESAARAYDRLAKSLHGEFAYLNFPDEESKTC